jgi:hypothetical protein
MEYDAQLPFYYNNNQRFLQMKLDPKIIEKSKIFEKAEIRWFSIDEIKNQKIPFRSYYKNIAELIIKNENTIDKFVRSKIRVNNNKLTKTVRKTSRKTSRKTNSRKRGVFSFLW